MSTSSTFECVAVGLVVLVLWAVLAGEIAAPSLGMGLAVALAAAVWTRLLDG